MPKEVEPVEMTFTKVKSEEYFKYRSTCDARVVTLDCLSEEDRRVIIEEALKMPFLVIYEKKKEKEKTD